jgi:hypothetical protein
VRRMCGQADRGQRQSGSHACQGVLHQSHEIASCGEVSMR